MGYARTCIVTTHRPSVLNLCDRVYKIDKSSVSEIDHQEVEQLIKRFLKRDNMKETYEDFLQLLKASINKSEVKINNVNWQSILQLSNIHKVLPLVYEALYKSEEFKIQIKIFKNILKLHPCKLSTIKFNEVSVFLQIYEEFNKKGVKSLYSKASYLGSYIQSPDERISEMRIY